jgi:hypothetical protein
VNAEQKLEMIGETLKRIADMPNAPEVDLSPITERLDELAELVLELSQPKTEWTFEIVRDSDGLISEVRAF